MNHWLALFVGIIIGWLVVPMVLGGGARRGATG